MERRVLLWGSLVVAAAGAGFWFMLRAWRAASAPVGTAEIGAAFLGLFLIVGVAWGFDLRDWFDR